MPVKSALSKFAVPGMNLLETPFSRGNLASVPTGHISNYAAKCLCCEDSRALGPPEKASDPSNYREIEECRQCEQGQIVKRSEGCEQPLRCREHGKNLPPRQRQQHAGKKGPSIAIFGREGQANKERNDHCQGVDKATHEECTTAGDEFDRFFHSSNLTRCGSLRPI